MQMPSGLPVLVPMTAYLISSSVTPGTSGRGTNSSRVASPPLPEEELPELGAVVGVLLSLELLHPAATRHTNRDAASTRLGRRDTVSPPDRSARRQNMTPVFDSVPQYNDVVAASGRI